MMKPPLYRVCFFVGIASLMTVSAGCERAYYKTLETFGKHKRDILVSRVGDARDAQKDANPHISPYFGRSW